MIGKNDLRRKRKGKPEEKREEEKRKKQGRKERGNDRYKQ